MAVVMVRQPSETPNITNIDDIIGLRYTYANQNGYVIGRGAIGTGVDAEAYTINGNNFIINSGRLVIQGVEVDIKNEHQLVIDINSTKRYYAVYLEVNLATNTSNIFVGVDDVGTPTIDLGEDLTANSVGVARMVLFTFEATNGLISNIKKVVKACEYSIPYKVDENGVLRYNDTIIPTKKELWKNLNGSTSASWTEELKVGDSVEVTYSLWLNRQTVKGVVYSESGSVGTDLYVRADYGYFTTTDAYQTATINIKPTSAKITRLAYGNHDYPSDPKIYKIVKVIE